MNGTGDVRQAWARVTGWLERNAPAVFADLGGPGSPEAISATEERLGLSLPEDMREWLLANDVGSCALALGSVGVVPHGGLLLGLTDIERVYRHRMSAPSGDPAAPSWRREWIPITAESDGSHGRFLDTRTGRVGTWTESSGPEEGVLPSLFAFFQDAADHLERVPPENGRLHSWARAHGFRVNNRGPVPASIREAYKSPS